MCIQKSNLKAWLLPVQGIWLALPDWENESATHIVVSSEFRHRPSIIFWAFETSAALLVRTPPS
jgi:hypothetical protein